MQILMKATWTASEHAMVWSQLACKILMKATWTASEHAWSVVSSIQW